jgi:hypothetical protein
MENESTIDGLVNRLVERAVSAEAERAAKMFCCGVAFATWKFLDSEQRSRPYRVTISTEELDASIKSHDLNIEATITPAGDKQFRATTTGGRNLGYFRSEGAAERVLRTYAGKVASNHKRRNA